jgi:peptide/nickel transport system substrate-binding protein
MTKSPHNLHQSLSVIALLPFVVAGCSASSGTEDAATYTHVIPQPVLVEHDPARAYTHEPKAMFSVYETLTYYNPDSGEVEPRLATEWDASDDGQEWTFELREDVTFHSGQPMTAQAVAAAIERTIAIGEGGAHLWDAVADIEATDEHTVAFELDYPAPLDLVAASSFGAFIYEVPAEEADEVTGHHQARPGAHWP